MLEHQFIHGLTEKIAGLVKVVKNQLAAGNVVTASQLTSFVAIEQGSNTLNVTVLEQSIALYIPQTIGVNTPMDTSAYAEEAKRFMSQLFGGVSFVEQGGIYRTYQGTFVAEQSTVIRSFTQTQNLHQHLPSLLQFAAWLQVELGQESVALEWNNKLLLLDAT